LGGLLLRELDSLYVCCKVKNQYMYFFLLLAAFYLGGIPHVSFPYLQASPGWYLLSLLKPTAMQDPKWFYLF